MFKEEKITRQFIKYISLSPTEQSRKKGKPHSRRNGKVYGSTNQPSLCGLRWGINTAAYIQNRYRTRVLDEITLYEE